MKTSSHLVLLFLAAVVVASPAAAQTQATLETITGKLESLERQNADLLEQVKMLRREVESLKVSPEGAARVEALEEQLELQGGRLAEQAQIKVESSQRVPLRLTGMALFNWFTNTRHGGSTDNPTIASIASGRSNSGATLRQSVVGLEFHGPEAILGGQFRGSVLMDLFGGSSEVLNQQVRLRTASIEGQWRTRGFLVGQDKPIFFPREPNSLAQVAVSPLTAAGNLWRWRPQARFEQRLSLGPAQQIRLRVGVSQTSEESAQIASQFLPTLEPKRPALEGHFQFSRRLDDRRRIEIAPGFHWSATHVVGLSVPSRVFSLDWFFNPHVRVEFTGAYFNGENLAKLGAGGVRQGFTIVGARPGEFRVNPVRSRGGWTQITYLVTPRLSFNLYGGQDDPHNRDLAPGGIVKNLAYAFNLFYRLAPNVVVGGEFSQVRTQFLSGQRPRNNHYDLAVAYLF